jgi:hypothetical protein
MPMTATVSTRELEHRLATLRRNEIPTALRNAINDTARDVARAESEEIGRVFDRPTPYVQRAPALTRRATKQHLQAKVTLRQGASVLKPHIPGYPKRRDLKAVEDMARARGYLGPGDWLVPSRTMRLDRYGNVSRATSRAIASDLSGRGARYVWGEVRSRRGGTVAGVWIASRWRAHQPGALALLAVRAPIYRARLDWIGVGRRAAARVIPGHAEAAIEHAIRRRAR